MGLELSDLLLCEFSKDGDGPHFYNCWNLCREIYRRVGRRLPRYSQYIRDLAVRDSLISRIKDSEDFIELTGPEPLAIVTLRMRPKVITHMGVVLDRRRFIHIGKRTGVVAPKLDDPKWVRRIEGFYRYVDVGNCKNL